MALALVASTAASVPYSHFGIDRQLRQHAHLDLNLGRPNLPDVLLHHLEIGIP